MGLKYFRIRQVRGGLNRILRKAQVPPDAPERISEKEAIDDEALGWIERVRATVETMPEYIDGFNEISDGVKRTKER